MQATDLHFIGSPAGLDHVKRRFGLGNLGLNSDACNQQILILLKQKFAEKFWHCSKS